MQRIDFFGYTVVAKSLYHEALIKAAALAGDNATVISPPPPLLASSAKLFNTLLKTWEKGNTLLRMANAAEARGLTVPAEP